MTHNVMNHTAPRLPIELYRIIINNLDRYKDQFTLCACSLTCKAFLHISRSLLFYDLWLLSKDDAKHFLELLSPDSYAYVRRLSIQEGRGRNELSAPWLNEALPFIVTRLPDITALEHNLLQWELLDNTTRSMVLSSFRKVENLRMLNAYFETSTQMNEFIASFPSLKDLSCQQAYCEKYDIPRIPLPHGITSIGLDSFQARFFNHLLSLEPHPDVRTIKLQSMHLEDVKDVGRLLMTLGSCLHHLYMSSISATVSFNPQVVLQECFDLSHNTNLRSFTLSHWLITPGYPGDWVFALWSQIVSPHIRRVATEMGLESLSYLDNVDWPQIERYFSQPRWANLDELVFQLWGEVEIRPTASVLIKARLPVLTGRGILKVRGYRDTGVCDV